HRPKDRSAERTHHVGAERIGVGQDKRLGVPIIIRFARRNRGLAIIVGGCIQVADLITPEKRVFRARLEVHPSQEEILVGVPLSREGGFPHPSIGTGRYLVARTMAAGEYSVGLIRLLMNGALNVSAPAPWHAADAKVVQSPASIWGVGTYATRARGAERWIVPWYPPKKNSLLETIGPPRTPPNWFLWSPSFSSAYG